MKSRFEFWTALAYLRHRKDALANWRHFFGDDFAVIEPLLVPCPGEYARHYLDPRDGVRWEVWPIDDGWIATLGDYDEDPPKLTEADVRLWRLKDEAFRERLRAGLHLSGSTSAVDRQIECLGVCANGPRRRRVYLCHAPEEKDALAAVLQIAGRTDGDGCALFPALTDTVERSLKSMGISGVSLFGNLKPFEPGAPVGACGFACRHLECGDGGIAALGQKIDAGFERVSNDRIADAVRIRTQKDAIGEMAVGPDRFLAGLQAQLSGPERELFFELVARKETPGGPRFLQYAEIGEHLKISKQAVQKRFKVLADRHPSVADYIRAIREPAKPTNFSEMSPSERRRQGVEESYGYDADG